MVGHVRKPHGTRGELFIRPLTDHPDTALAPDETLYVAGADERTPDGDLPPLRVESVRPFRKGFLVRFDGVLDRTAAEQLRDRYLLLPFERAAALGEDEIFHHDLVGMRVETLAGEDVGRVAEIYELRPADLVEVIGEAGRVLVPLVRDVVVEVDREGRRLVIDPPEGLLDL